MIRGIKRKAANTTTLRKGEEGRVVMSDYSAKNFEYLYYYITKQSLFV